MFDGKKIRTDTIFEVTAIDLKSQLPISFFFSYPLHVLKRNYMEIGFF